MASCTKKWVPILGVWLHACSPQNGEIAGSQERFSLMTLFDGAALAVCKGNDGQSLRMRYFGGQGRVRIKGTISGIAFDSAGAIDHEESSRYIHSWFEGSLHSITESAEKYSLVLRMAAGTKMETDSEIAGRSDTFRESKFSLQEIWVHRKTGSLTFMDQNNKAVQVHGCKFQNLTNIVNALNAN